MKVSGCVIVVYGKLALPQAKVFHQFVWEAAKRGGSGSVGGWGGGC